MLSSCQNCLAWCSFDSIVGRTIGISDDVHEDMTEIAFKMLLKYDHRKKGSLTKKDWKHVLQLLRQGSYWNDIQTENITSFIYYYSVRNNINPYKGASGPINKYKTVYDICEHASQNMDVLHPNDRYSIAIKFSHNNKANFLHSMLNYNPDNTACSQLQTKQFIMEWLEFAYKYALSASPSKKQKPLLVFTDANEELNGSLTTKDLQIRILGMLCHTLQDSYNPSHTSRSAYNGEIKAFSNYEKQNNHSKFDKISNVDNIAREKLLNSDRLSLGDMDSIINKLQTPGFKESIIQTYKLLKKFNSNTKCNNLKQWLDNEVFSTDFDENGNTKIMDGGRYCEKIVLNDHWANNIKSEIKTCSAINKTDISTIEDALIKYYKWLNKETEAFYPKKLKSLTISQKESLKQLQIIIDVLYSKCSSYYLSPLPPESRKATYDFLLLCNQLIQDYCMDLGPNYTRTAQKYQSETTFMINSLK